MSNSTSDFKARSNDIFDKLTNLEKQHDTHIKIHTPISLVDDEVSALHQNPTIPTNAITFKKRPTDDIFSRPANKWQKYDLDDVNEHHLTNMGNRYAFNDFLRTRVKPSIAEKVEEDIQTGPIFQRPIKKQILRNDDEDDHCISMRTSLSSNTIENMTDNGNDDDETMKYKLKSMSRKPRGVLSTNEKRPIKHSNEIFEGRADSNDDINDDILEKSDNEDEKINDELFEP